MGKTVIDIILFASAVICGYLLGSLNFAVIISKGLYHDDVRTHGSGNAGTTNMLRSFGKKAAALTFLGDFLKGAVAAVLFGLIFMWCGRTYVMGATVAGFAAVLGHNWPVFFKFKGGKGVLCSFSVLLCVMPLQALCALCIFVVIVAITRYVSLGSVLSAISVPVITVLTKTGSGFTGSPDVIFLLVFSALISALVVLRHRSNIHRLFAGKESKLSFSKKD